MIQINLLPWREAARKKKLMFFYKNMGISAVIGVVVVIVMHTHYSGLLAKQNQRNAYLQAQISTESKQVQDLRDKLQQSESILKQLNAIVSLKEQGYQVVNFLNELIRIVPEDVFFRRVDYKGDRVLVLGRASSNLKITMLLKNIAKSALFHDPDLTEISVKGTSMGEERVFQLTFSLSNKAQ